MRSLKIISFFLLMLIASPALADGQGKVFLPDWFIIAIYSVWMLLAIAVATVISFLFKIIYERLRKEKRRTVLRMIVFTFVFPSLYAFIVNANESLYTFGPNYSRSESENTFWLIISVLTFAGFNVGYFITPKSETGKLSKRTTGEKKKAILIQLIFCVILPSLILYMSISPELKRLKRLTKKNVRVSAQTGVLPNKNLEKNIYQPKCFGSRAKS